MNELNQKIHEWLGKCWHDKGELSFPNGLIQCVCGRCGQKIEQGGMWKPDYTIDPAAMLELIEAVREKGFLFRIENVEFPEKSEWEVLIVKNGHGRRERTSTLPMAVALAVSKLIDTTHVDDGREIQG
jgi:hypothetical protein